MDVLLHACIWTMQMPVGSPGTGVTDGSEPPCEWWELNPHPLQEQLVLLTADSSPDPSNININEHYWLLFPMSNFCPLIAILTDKHIWFSPGFSWLLCRAIPAPRTIRLT